MKSIDTPKKPLSVSVLGMGNMGSALARAFVSGGLQVTVWNRTPNKAQEFADEINNRSNSDKSVEFAMTAPEAVSSSDVVVISLIDYVASDNVLLTDEMGKLLAGKTVVQLTTGTPQQAKIGAQWASENNIDYLDGVIMGMAYDVGKEEMLYLFSGSKSGYERVERLLAALGGESKILGENPGLASGFYLAANSWYCSVLFTYIQGVSLCKSEGVDLDFYTEMSVASIERIVPPLMRQITENIKHRDYPGKDATLEVYESTLKNITQMCNDNRNPKGALDEMLSIMREGIAAGHGKSDLSSLFEVFEKNK